jgi:signal transduction histidine kinase
LPDHSVGSIWGKAVEDRPDWRGIEISRWTLRFSDPARERQFRKSWLKATTRATRLWVACGIGFISLFTVMLLVFLGREHHGLMWIRYTIAIPFIVLTQIPIVFPNKKLRLFGPAYLSGSLAAFGMALFLFVFSAGGHNIVFVVEMAAAFVFCQHYGRIVFRYTLVFSTIAGSATLAAIAMKPALIGVPFVPVAIAIASLVLVGIFSAYTSEYFVRRSYLSMQVLKAEVARNAGLAEQATAASQAKSRFLAIVGHELRTPLNAIIGYADTIQAGIFGPVENDKVRGAVVDIYGSGRHLLGIVNDVLDLSNATMGPVELEESLFDPLALIGESVLSFEGACAERGVRVDVDDDPDLPQLHADRRLVRRMLGNLISNAITYSEKGGEIWLSAAADSSGALTIEIKDTGIGIAPETLERAMEAFGQVDDDLNRRYEGIGIGLPLTRSLIELHGGSMTVESAVGRGTRVRLTFPPGRVIAASSPSEIARPDAA